jgi:protein-tyrosine phosphatase
MTSTGAAPEHEAVEDEVALRLLKLEGGRNFRDMGGYPTQDGRRVRWGKLFRSGSMARLTAQDWETLVARGIRTVCDLRTTAEREMEPFAWAEAPGLNYFARDYETSFGELRRVMASGFADHEAAKAGMVAGYRELPFEQSPAYRVVFGHLKANDVPLVVNCTAGKDRAGTASALILSALGVPREIVVQDFLLTNRTVDLMRILSGKSPTNVMATQPMEVAKAIFMADPSYINAALDSLHERHGSIEGFLKDVLDVNAEELAAIRAALLE